MTTIGKLFKYPIIIQETELDVFGHVNNASYFVLLENARWDLLNKTGMSLGYIREQNIGPVILDINIRFIKELKARQEITIETQIISFEKKIGKLAQRMVQDDEVFCEAMFTIGVFDLQQRKLLYPTKDQLKLLGVD